MSSKTFVRYALKKIPDHFKVTEKLTKDLAMAENDNTQLKTNIKETNANHTLILL